jgi:hypothetical protein
MKTLLLTFITFIGINAKAMDMNKITSMEFAKPCNTSNIIKMIHQWKRRSL